MSSSNDSSSSGQETSQNSNLTLLALGIATSVALFLFVLIYYMKESINDWRQGQLAPVVSTITTAPVIPDQPSNGGLDLDDISLLPKFIYRPSKTSFRRKDKHNHNQKGKGKALLAECAVCISELEEGDIVRVLPTCKHFFHVKCIDTWLCAHSSCPMCRAHPEPEKVKLGVISASPPLPQLTRCGTMSERKQSINFGSLFGSPFMKNSSRGVSPYWHGSSLQGSPYMFTPPRGLSQETRIEVRFLDDSEIHEITERIS